MPQNYKLSYIHTLIGLSLFNISKKEPPQLFLIFSLEVGSQKSIMDKIKKKNTK